MSNVTKNDVLDFFNDNRGTSFSATAVARGLGLNKKNVAIDDAIYNLLGEGEIVYAESPSSAYCCYTAAEGTEEEEYSEEENSNTVEFDDNLKEVGTFKVCGNIPEMLNGYTMKFSESRHGLINVTLPNGRVHPVQQSERLLVINKSKHYVIGKPEDILLAADDFSRENDIGTFVITDPQIGKAVDVKAVDTEPMIVFKKVERQNKAGLI